MHSRAMGTTAAPVYNRHVVHRGEDSSKKDPSAIEARCWRRAAAHPASSSSERNDAASISSVTARPGASTRTFPSLAETLRTSGRNVVSMPILPWVASGQGLRIVPTIDPRQDDIGKRRSSIVGRQGRIQLKARCSNVRSPGPRHDNFPVMSNASRALELYLFCRI